MRQAVDAYARDEQIVSFRDKLRGALGLPRRMISPKSRNESFRHPPEIVVKRVQTMNQSEISKMRA